LPDGRTLRLVRMRDPHGGISLLFSDMTDSMTLKSQLGTLINVQKATLDKDSLKDNPRFSKLIEASLPLYHDTDFWDSLKARATDPNPDVRRHVDGEIKRSDDKMLTWLSRPLPDGATLVAWDDVTSARRAEAALIERAEALVSDKQSEYIFAIQSASEDLAKTIDDILDIAAIEANVLDLELGDVDVYHVLEHSLDYVATKAEDTRISMVLKCQKDIGIIRRCGPSRVVC